MFQKNKTTQNTGATVTWLLNWIGKMHPSLIQTFISLLWTTLQQRN